MSAPVARDTVHATALVVGEAGVLLRGVSGAGKSALALAVIAAARSRGRFARLVGDDRVRLARIGGALVARPHPALAGQVERRFVGVSAARHEQGAVVRLLVDLVARDPARNLPPRAPDAAEATALLLGVRVARMAVPIGDLAAAPLIFSMIETLRRSEGAVK